MGCCAAFAGRGFAMNADARRVLEASRTGGPVPVIVTRCETFTEPVAGSLRRRCSTCAAEVWLTPSALNAARVINGGPAEPALVCDGCLEEGGSR